MAKRRFHQSSPQKNFAPVVITIEDLSRGGAGVGRDERGRVIFVPFTAPGDMARVKLHKIKRRFAEGELIQLIKSSSLRETPHCPVFSRCGGCQWQHIPYQIQWQTKEEGVKESLRLARVEVPEDWRGFPAQQVWEYRNRIQLRGRGSTIGFYAKQSKTLIPVTRCDIAHPAINAEIEAIAVEGERLQQPYKVELFVDDSGKVMRVWNEQHGAAGFRQINEAQNSVLQEWIKLVFPSVSGLLDLYGGSGNLSLPLIELTGEIHCVDIGSPGPRLAPDMDKLHFHRSPVLPWLKARLAQLRQKQISVTGQKWGAIIDPPRGGLGDDTTTVIDALDKHNVETLVLVGCKTDPWSRDIARFVDSRWSLRKVAVFDFFPQTSHVESAALLTRG